MLSAGIAATRKLLCFDTQNRTRCIDNQTPCFRLCLERNAELQATCLERAVDAAAEVHGVAAFCR